MGELHALVIHNVVYYNLSYIVNYNIQVSRLPDMPQHPRYHHPMYIFLLHKLKITSKLLCVCPYLHMNMPHA
jgi:hypothetical protein